MKWNKNKAKVETVQEKKPSQQTAEPRTAQLSRWIQECVKVTGHFEGNHGYATISDNFDGQGFSCGVMNWNLGQGTICGLFPDDLILKYMDESAPDFIYMTNKVRSQMDRIERCKRVQQDTKTWMNFCEDLTALLTSPEGIEIQNDVIKKTFGKFALENLPPQYPSLRAFMLLFDIAVQNGSLKGVKFGDGYDEKTYQEKFSSTYNINQYKLIKMAEARAAKCNPRWAADVLCRKMFIATGEGYGRALNAYLPKNMEEVLVAE